MHVTGLVFWVLDNTVSVKFYKKLGFEVTYSTDLASAVRLGDFTITLVSTRDEDEFGHDSMAREKGRGMYVYIRVDDIDGIYQMLQRRGVSPHTQPRNWDWGNREFVVKDPDGYKLCFWQPIS